MSVASLHAHVLACMCLPDAAKVCVEVHLLCWYFVAVRLPYASVSPLANCQTVYPLKLAFN